MGGRTRGMACCHAAVSGNNDSVGRMRFPQERCIPLTAERHKNNINISELEYGSWSDLQTMPHWDM